jgi:TetR/AcrR family transcriptional regulator, tetracycline repressor protein
MSQTSARQLNRDLIVRAALELADSDGVDAVSMRRIGARLGVTPMAVYRHFRDKAELTDSMVDALVAETSVDTSAASWREGVAELMRSIRRTLVAHPVAVELRHGRPALSPSALRLSERGMALLTEGGFSRGEAARAYRALFAYTFGSVAFPIGRGDSRAALAALDPAEYPVLSASIDEVAETADAEEQFEFGLARLLDGLEARVA